MMMMMTMMMMMMMSCQQLQQRRFSSKFKTISQILTEANLFKFCSLHKVHKTHDIEAVWSTAAAPFITAFPLLFRRQQMCGCDRSKKTVN